MTDSVKKSSDLNHITLLVGTELIMEGLCHPAITGLKLLHL